MTSVFQQWLAAEFAVAEAEAQFRAALARYESGQTTRPPSAGSLIRARVLRHEARNFLARMARTLAV